MDIENDHSYTLLQMTNMNNVFIFTLIFVLGAVVNESLASPLLDTSGEGQASSAVSSCHTQLDQYIEMVEMMEFANPNEYCSILVPMREHVSYIIDNCKPFLPDMNFANAGYLREIDEAIIDAC